MLWKVYLVSYNLADNVIVVLRSEVDQVKIQDLRPHPLSAVSFF